MIFIKLRFKSTLISELLYHIHKVNLLDMITSYILLFKPYFINNLNFLNELFPLLNPYTIN